MGQNYTDLRHHLARFPDPPEGFNRHRRGKPPIGGRVYVELLHKTDEGWAIGPRVRADLISQDRWDSLAKHKGRWRLAPEIEEPERPEPIAPRQPEDQEQPAG